MPHQIDCANLDAQSKAALFEQLGNLFHQGLLLIDSIQVVRYANVRMLRMLNLEPEIIGSPLAELLPGIDTARTDSDQKYQYGEATFYIDIKQMATQTEAFSLLLFNTLPHAMASNPLILAGLLKLTEVIDEGINITDNDSIIRFYNKRQLQRDGANPKDVIGKRVYEDGMITKETSVLHKVIQTGAPVLDYEQHYCNFNNVFTKLHGCAYPIFDDQHLLGALGVFREPKPNTEAVRKIIVPKIITAVETPGTEGGDTSLYSFDDMVGRNKQFLQQVAMAKVAAEGVSPIFLFGETGTGKEVFAQSIHRRSERRRGAFIAINCAAVPENLFEGILFGTTKGAFTGAKNRKGLLEESHRGTLFLDEINSMPLLLQGKLLRVLEEKRVRRLGGEKEKPLDLRVISSSNVDPRQAIQENIIRQDLFYRLAVIFIHLPPLRQRLEDIVPLTNRFVETIGAKLKKNVKMVHPETLRIIHNHNWPGNVRQLRHYIESIISLTPDDETVLSHTYMPHYYNFFSDGFPEPASGPNSNKLSGAEETAIFEGIWQKERNTIVEALIRNNGNRTKTAQNLGITRRSLYYRIKKYEIR